MKVELIQKVALKTAPSRLAFNRPMLCTPLAGRNHLFWLIPMSLPAFWCQLPIRSSTWMLVDLFFYFLYFSFFLRFLFFFLVVAENDFKHWKMILTSKQGAQHPFAGKNTQHPMLLMVPYVPYDSLLLSNEILRQRSVSFTP